MKIFHFKVLYEKYFRLVGNIDEGKSIDISHGVEHSNKRYLVVNYCKWMERTVKYTHEPDSDEHECCTIKHICTFTRADV
jgi:hypothetical protein